METRNTRDTENQSGMVPCEIGFYRPSRDLGRRGSGSGAKSVWPNQIEFSTSTYPTCGGVWRWVRFLWDQIWRTNFSTRQFSARPVSLRPDSTNLVSLRQGFVSPFFTSLFSTSLYSPQSTHKKASFRQIISSSSSSKSIWSGSVLSKLCMLNR